jgi:hypothetical protein
MEDTTNNGCIHRWVLGEPGLGGISGSCRNCGASRLYPASLDMYEHVPDYDEQENNKLVRSLELTTLGERAPA